MRFSNGWFDDQANVGDPWVEQRGDSSPWIPFISQITETSFKSYVSNGVILSFVARHYLPRSCDMHKFNRFHNPKYNKIRSSKLLGFLRQRRAQCSPLEGYCRRTNQQIRTVSVSNQHWRVNLYMCVLALDGACSLGARVILAGRKSKFLRVILVQMALSSASVSPDPSVGREGGGLSSYGYGDLLINL